MRLFKINKGNAVGIPPPPRARASGPLRPALLATHRQEATHLHRRPCLPPRVVSTRSWPSHGAHTHMGEKLAKPASFRESRAAGRDHHRHTHTGPPPSTNYLVLGPSYGQPHAELRCPQSRPAVGRAEASGLLWFLLPRLSRRRDRPSSAAAPWCHPRCLISPSSQPAREGTENVPVSAPMEQSTRGGNGVLHTDRATDTQKSKG